MEQNSRQSPCNTRNLKKVEHFILSKIFKILLVFYLIQRGSDDIGT